MPVDSLAATPARDCPGLVRQGRITEALASLTADDVPDVAAQALLLECHLARGDMDHALGLGERLADPARLAPGTTPDVAARVAWALGELHAATGRDEAALTHYRRAGDLHDDPVDVPWRAGAATALLRAGQAREAQRHATEQVALARATGSAYALAGALRTVAAVCLVDRTRTLREALALTAGHERLAAQCGTDLAGLLVLAGSAREAVGLLRSAEAYADREDLWPLHTRVRRLLERLGETPHTSRAEALARLTHAELRAARLAAAGATNRSIAADVGVSVKAVEWHLSHAYRKLGVAGRRELPRVFRAG